MGFSQQNDLPNTSECKFVVTDSESGEPLFKAHILIKDKDNNLLTDFSGIASIKLSKGVYEILVSYVGYEKYSATIDTHLQSEFALALKPSVFTTDEVTILAEAENAHIQGIEAGSKQLSIKDIQDLPFLLGEVDPLKSIQYLPGVQSSGEGNSGIYVRGGTLDQNLILMDDVPVYNPSHLFGFFSIFNGNTVEKFNILKGGIPAQFGGRLSSILEVNSKNADKNQTHLKGNFGVLSAAATLEVPVINKKSSLLVSARRTYVDLILKGLSNSIEELKKQPNYYFYDLNVNYDHLITKKDRLTFNLYKGTDDFLYQGVNDFENSIRWQNQLGSVKWQHVFNPDLISDFTVYATDYQLNLGAVITNYELKLSSGIRDYGAKFTLSSTNIKKHNITIGADYVWHRFTPNNIVLGTKDDAIDLGQPEKLYALEAATFVNDEFEWNEKILVNVGLRLSGFMHRGPFTRYLANETGQTLDTLFYKSGANIQTYSGLEPRASFRYKLNDASSIKGSFDRTFQYIHLAPVSSVSLPTDIWVPSSEKIQPQIGTQYSIGYFKSFEQNAWEASAVLYYKFMQNQVEYRNGVLFGYSSGNNFDDNFTFGKGKSIGLEMYVEKKTGRFTGWLSYTLSKTTRKFSELNQGKIFPAKYDRLHDLSFVGNYKLNERWKFSSVFVYATGNRLTLPTGRYLIDGNVINDYGSKNKFLMPKQMSKLGFLLKSKHRFC